MKVNLSLLDDFGLRLADGSKAAEYRQVHIDPYFDMCQSIELNFTGIRTANSSFMNALISGVLQQHGEKALEVLSFKGCNPVIRVLVEAAIDLGLQKYQERVAA